MLKNFICIFDSLSYSIFQTKEKPEGPFVFASTIEVYAFSGFWRRIITLLVKEFFFFFFLGGGGVGVEMRDDKEREWCVGSSLEMGTGIYKLLLHIWWNNCYNHIFACCFFKVYFSYKWRPFIFHHCQIILYTALQRRIYWVAF